MKARLLFNAGGTSLLKKADGLIDITIRLLRHLGRILGYGHLRDRYFPLRRLRRKLLLPPPPDNR